MPDVVEVVNEQLQNHNYIIFCYRIIDDPTDKFILMACLQLGYSQGDVARMLNISQAAVSHRLKDSRNCLKLHQSEVIL